MSPKDGKDVLRGFYKENINYIRKFRLVHARTRFLTAKVTDVVSKPEINHFCGRPAES